MTKEWAYEDEWFEETNVSRKVKDFLVKKGYQIIKFNEDKRKRGADIIAINRINNQKLIVEVKGFPSDKYVRGEKKGNLNLLIQIYRLNNGFQKLY